MRQVMMAAAAAGLAWAGAAHAEVTEQAAHGFQVRQVVEIAAPAAQVWDALIQPGRWWDPQHTWSGDARNLRIEPRAGGCFCETLPDGGVLHMTVAYVKRNAQLDLWGGLGPLHFEGVAGAMAIRLTPAGQGTRVEMTYTVGGFARGGLQKWSAPVDGVLGMQFARLERYVETGRPAAPSR
jgi:uncharacterized protein YndB with AHSA1/START domain